MVCPSMHFPMRLFSSMTWIWRYNVRLLYCLNLLKSALFVIVPPASSIFSNIFSSNKIDLFMPLEKSNGRIFRSPAPISVASSNCFSRTSRFFRSNKCFTMLSHGRKLPAITPVSFNNNELFLSISSRLSICVIS